MDINDIQLESLKLQVKLLQKKCKQCNRTGPTKAGLCLARCYPERQKEKDQGRIGDEYVDSKGYTRLYIFDGDEVRIAYKHRHLKAQELGRELAEYETVLFRDNNKSNLDPSNLVLGLKGGIALEEVVCPHCERKYGNGKAESSTEEATEENGHDCDPNR